jgi:hypothetical protein
LLIDLLRFNRAVQTIAVVACLFVTGKLMLGGQVPPVPSRRPAYTPTVGSGYLTHISTDKPIYRLGEKVYVRGVILSADGHLPSATEANGSANFEIRGPKGEMVASGVAALVDSVVGFSWDIPAGQSGGEYKVRILHPLTGDAPAERKFDIRAYRAPRLKSQIVFLRDGYGLVTRSVPACTSIALKEAFRPEQEFLSWPGLMAKKCGRARPRRQRRECER